MKKLLIGVLALIMLFSFFGCNSDPNAETYNKACRLFVEGKYIEAKAIYELLNDYSNSNEMVKKCDEKEIEKLLQGRWEISEGESMPFSIAEFKDGIYKITSIGKEETIWSTGVYWIDFDAQLIYLCNEPTDNFQVEVDFTIDNQTVHGAIASIVGYHKYCTYTFNDNKLELLHIDSEINAKYTKQETAQ